VVVVVVVLVDVEVVDAVVLVVDGSVELLAWWTTGDTRRAPSTSVSLRELESASDGIALAMPTEPTISAIATSRVIQRRECI
jgi:hypothetical protein